MIGIWKKLLRKLIPPGNFSAKSDWGNNMRENSSNNQLETHAGTLKLGLELRLEIFPLPSKYKIQNTKQYNTKYKLWQWPQTRNENCI